MIGINVKKKRFTLLYLEENELYVQDLSGSCTFPDYITGSKRVEKGKIHLCSKSIIFEPSNVNVPIQKFLFKYLKNDPRRSLEIFNEKHNDTSLQKLFDKGQTYKNDSIIFQMNRVIEISTTGPPSPYIIHDDAVRDITIVPAFENVAKLMDKINKLIEFSKNGGLKADQQEELNKLILEDSKLKFNMSYLESITEKPLVKNQTIAKRILPLVSIHGVFYLTNRNLYFQTLHSVVTKPVKIIHLEEITNLFRRRYELQQIGLEIYTKKKSYFFAFNNTKEREEIYNILIERLGKEFESKRRLEHVMEQWQKKEISNYEYLLFLNEAADRTFSDLTQYPVFPWIITDYESKVLDLTDPKKYRDLSKPIGALNPARLEQFRERYKMMNEPKYMYGTHYSAPGYVIGYLVRKHPQHMLKLQSGKFDKPDRLFWSMERDWNNVINNHAISKELIPEFYEYDDSFLVNYQKLDLGIRQTGERVNDVELPPWAKDSKDFLRINRLALESPYVSENLHNWIDLIFGYKQQGPEALKADNVFHYLTYEGAVDIEAIADPVERNAIKLQINEFGQTPKQLFKNPHPPRHDFKVQIYDMRSSTMSRSQTQNVTAAGSEGSSDENDEFELLETVKGRGKVEAQKKEDSDDDQNDSDDEKKKVENSDDEEEALGEMIKGIGSKKIGSGVDTLWEARGFQKLKMEQLPKVHKSQVSGLWELPDKRILSIGYDGFIKITQFQSMSVSRSFKVCDLSLSTVAELKKNELYALGSWDNNLYIFNLNYGTKVFNEPLHEDAISFIAFDNNRSVLYTTSWDCTVRSWGYKGGQIDTSSEQIIAETNSQVSKMKLSSDGNMLLYGDLEGFVHLYDLRKSQSVASFSVGNEKITSLHFLSNKQIVASGETFISLNDMSGKPIKQIPVDPKLGLITDMDREGTHLIISTDRGNSSVYSVFEEKRIGAFCHENGLKDGEISPDYEFTCLKIMSEGRMGVFGSQSGSLTFNYYSDMKKF